MKIAISLFLLVAFICAGCTESCVNEPSNTKNEIKPLEIGNVWNHNITVFTRDSILIREYILTERIVKDTIVSNERWFLSNFEGHLPGPWSVNRDTGYWLKPRVNDTLSFYTPPYLKYKYPCIVGDVFEDGVGSDWEVISVDTTVEVQSGTFKCILYRTKTYYNIQSGYAEDFVALNFGQVWGKFYNRLANGDAYLFSNRELISFELAN
jgi:hypothetical protein